MYQAQHETGKPAYHLEFDISQNSVTRLKQQALEFKSQLTGWCSERKACILIDLILKSKAKKIVEIGVYGGQSLVPMACALKALGQGVVYGIDPWDNVAALERVMNADNKNYWATVPLSQIMQDLIQKIPEFNLENQIVLIKNTSAETPPIEEIDILHIDGNHSEVTSFPDVLKWVPLVKSGGYIIFDDMTWYENGTFTTAKAVEWLNTHCIKFAEFRDNCDWGIWIKP